MILGVLLASSAWMSAIGWYVQVVHYPAFRFVPADRFAEFHGMHSTLTGLLVVPPMLAQLAAALLALLHSDRLPWWWLAGSVAALALSFGWTLAVSGPMHGVVLAQGPQGEAVGRLIASCWVRNIAWMAHAALALAALCFELKPAP